MVQQSVDRIPDTIMTAEVEGKRPIMSTLKRTSGMVPETASSGIPETEAAPAAKSEGCQPHHFGLGLRLGLRLGCGLGRL